jgi:hypothetical protein
VANHARKAGFVVEDIQMWEGRPEYLRLSVPSYLLGYLYERTVNRFSFLSRFRCVLFFSLRKPVGDRLERAFDAPIDYG